MLVKNNIYLITSGSRKNKCMVASVIILLSNRTLMSLKRPVYAGSQIFFIIQTRLHHRSSQTVLFKFYNFPADILSLLHILFWLTDSLLPICCHSIIAVLKLFRNHYFEYTASFLERRYTQYWFMLIPSLCECSASDRCRLRGILNLNWPE